MIISAINNIIHDRSGFFCFFCVDIETINECTSLKSPLAELVYFYFSKTPKSFHFSGFGVGFAFQKGT